MSAGNIKNTQLPEYLNGWVWENVVVQVMLIQF